ncbi:MAG: hypothetical protein HN742_09035 [Lentisphaerae bacterium]|jgi:hypothetical protein|nr:hypothetical protein [Lentisphaerota bacterium]MBT4814769.1 hypothetical protein [Lentisphaerota bacterium]MBT5610635.1 hypothetical protein [Lentisphaerota bacterium]MBT7057292.1 hypothetical protein [Lentisphaerota bacterium]MBT7842004.1 hypothetical protein [Lentisphaerota bacterium]
MPYRLALMCAARDTVAAFLNRRLLLLVAFIGASYCMGEPRRFYVAPDGDDSSPGTADQPFATIERAQQAVRALNLPTAEGGPVTVLLRGGAHCRTTTLTFTPADTGTAASPVTYMSHPGERAVISGGKRLSGTWRPSVGKPYVQLDVPEARDRQWVFNSLYVNGMSRQRARTPNWGKKVFRAEGRAPGENERKAFIYLPGDIDPAWTNATDADIVLLCSWTPTLHRIEEILADRRVVKFESTHGRSVDFWEKHFRYYVINLLEALDEPGEWYLDRKAGVVYYYPLPGEDMATAEVIAPVMKSRMLEFLGTPASSELITHLRFRDLDFCHLDGDLDRYNGVYRQGHMYLDSALVAEGLCSTAFTNCVFAQLGEYAIEMMAGCRDNRIERCHIWDIGAGAIQLGITSLGPLLAGQNKRHEGDVDLEAEEGTVEPPMILAEDTKASGGQYAVLPDGSEGGSVTFTVQLEQPGRFRLLTRVIAPNGGQDSFMVQINAGAAYTYDTGNGRRWFLSQVVGRELEGKPLVADLKKGTNTITIKGRESGTCLDQLILRREDQHQEHSPSAVEVRGNVIDNNCIHRLGTIWHGCYGIVNRFASQTQITHNDIFDTHWDAIGLDARWNYNGETYSHGTVVAYNHLHHLGLRYHTDAAGVYQFGPLDTHIHHNVVHDNVAYPRICGFAGIYLDEQSRNAVVENNLVYNVEWHAYFQHKGVDNVFRNNIGAFARDGFIRRGGLNQNWQANHMEAHRNIYIADDSIGLRSGWQPGDRPPVLRNNLYHTLAPDAELTFAGKPFADWQAEGQDNGSVIADPGCRDPANGDFTLRPDAAAIKAIGFVPFDSEIKKAGLYGDSAWRSLPERCERRTPSDVWTAEDMRRFLSFSMDFEDMPVGHKPATFRIGTSGEDATFVVTDEAACTGTKSYKCIDRAGLRKPFYPYIHLAPRSVGPSKVRFSFDVMNSETAPMRFYVEFRGKGSTSDVGPSLHFHADGKLVANDADILTARPGTWCHVAIALDLAEDAPKQYSLVTRHAGQEKRQTLPYRHDTFSDLRWLGISAAEDADGVFYLDNVSLTVE